MRIKPIELSDSDSNLDCFSAAHSLRFIVALVDTNQEVEKEGIDLKQRSGLKGLMANMNKGQSSKDVPKVIAPASLPLPPPPPTDPGLQANPNLRRKRPVDELKEGEVGPQRAKQQKKAKEPKEKSRQPR